MKRLPLALFFVCCTLAIVAQEDGFRVNYQGAKPTIKDFALAYITSLISEAEECDEEGMSLYENLQDAIKCQAKGLPLESNRTLTIDQKNGFLVYEHKYIDYLGRIEMCYWNEADGKHKLFACNRWSFENGKPMMGQYDYLGFYRYDIRELTGDSATSHIRRFIMQRAQQLLMSGATISETAESLFFTIAFLLCTALVPFSGQCVTWLKIVPKRW